MKGRQLRRKEEDSESDDETGVLRAQLQAKKSRQSERTTTTGAISSGQKVKVPLSFQSDSGDEDAPEIVLKKSKARGIPVPLPEVDQYSRSKQSTTSMYDTESLAALKMKQNFSTSSNAFSHDVIVDGGFEVELVGDDAEALEQKMEAEEEAREKDAYVPGSYSASSRAAEDEYLLRNGRASTAALKNEKFVPDDDLTGKFSAVQEDKAKAGFEAPGLELNEWEEELLRRTGIKARTLNELDIRSLKSTVKSLSKGPLQPGGETQSVRDAQDDSSITDVPSNEEIVANIDKAISSLEISTVDIRKRIEQLKKAREDAQKAEAEAQIKLAKGNEKMKVVSRFQLFCAEYVGMIRVKEPLIVALKDELYSYLRERKDALRQRRRLDQEDLAMRVKESCGFISFGSYTPIGALLFDTQDNLEQQQREYRRKQRISQRIGQETINFDGSSEAVVKAETDSDIDTTLDEESECSAKLFAISLRASRMLDDVRSDLRSVVNVIQHFQEMKLSDPEKYKLCYFGMSLLTILEPLLTLDTLTLRPLHDELNLSSRTWHEPLQQYSIDAEEAKNSEDDAVLLPKLVLKIFLPIAETIISSHFDLFSSVSSKLLLSLIEQIIEYDPSTEELSVLLQALSHECSIAQDDICIPLLTVSPPQSCHKIK